MSSGASASAPRTANPAAMRPFMDCVSPTGRNRPVAIELPVIKTPEDAELALTVVTDELAAGNLTISEASGLVALIDRMLRVAERMWKFQQARLEAGRDRQVRQAAAEAPEAAEKPSAPLYSPVNSREPASADSRGAPSVRKDETAQSGAPHAATAAPLSRAA
jgi:hypothetical protein